MVRPDGTRINLSAIDAARDSTARFVDIGAISSINLNLLPVGSDGDVALFTTVSGGGLLVAHPGVNIISPSANKLSISVVVATGSESSDLNRRVVAVLLLWAEFVLAIFIVHVLHAESLFFFLVLLALQSLLELILSLLHLLQLNLLLRDLEAVVLVGRLLLVHSGTEAQHAADNDDGTDEHDHRVDCESLREMDAQRVYGKPMQHLNSPEEEKHGDDSKIVEWCVLVHELVELV